MDSIVSASDMECDALLKIALQLPRTAGSAGGPERCGWVRVGAPGVGTGASHRFL